MYLKKVYPCIFQQTHGPQLYTRRTSQGLSSNAIHFLPTNHMFLKRSDLTLRGSCVICTSHLSKMYNIFVDECVSLTS